MMKLGRLAITGILGLSAITYAGSFDELKQLLNSKDINIDLGVAGYYFYTTDRDDSIGGNDNFEDIFTYSAVLGLHKEATDQSPFGFGVSVGQAWFPVVGSEPFPKPDDANGAFSDSNSNFGVFEAYAEAKVSFLKITAGRFATNIGGELPFTWQNVNIQRGLVWAGEPVWYDGVRVSADIGQFSVYAGVNDRDTDDGKMAAEGGISVSLPFATSVSLNVLIPDKKDSWNTRTYNLTITNGYFKILPLTLYVDYLNTPKNSENKLKSDADSIGVALLGEFKATNNISVGGRVEYVNNDGDGDNYGIGTGNNAWTFTITPKYQINKYLSIRVEASYVKLGNDKYQKHDNKPNSKTDNEFRAGLEIAFVF